MIQRGYWLGLLLAMSATVAAGFDDHDRRAFLGRFTYLANAQFERQTSDATDCAA